MTATPDARHAKPASTQTIQTSAVPAEYAEDDHESDL